MPRRAPVRMACQPCRKSRTKCDGASPCARCDSGGFDCTYDERKAVSKDSLRAEIRRLQQLQLDSDTLLNALVSNPSSCAHSVVVQGLQRGDSRQSIALGVAQLRDGEACNLTDGSPSCSDNDVMDGEWTTTSSSYSGQSSAGSTANSSQQACPIDFCSYCQSDSSSSPSSARLPIPISEVPASTALPQTIDSWTKSGWPKAHVRALIDDILGWDGMLFCAVWRDSLLHDFDRGGTQFCSSALVNALLALATRSKESGQNGNQSVDFQLQPVNTSSDGFFAEATALLPKKGGRPSNLADIQALGLLALYEASAGREDQAQKLADEFVASIIDLCLHERSLAPAGSSYQLARTSTYCGALSLLRVLRLSQPRNYQHKETVPQLPQSLIKRVDVDDTNQLLDHPKEFTQGALLECCNCDKSTDLETAEDHLSTPVSHVDGSQRMFSKIFQLTGWTYNLRMQSPSPTFQESVAVYVQCLEWYHDLFKDGTSFEDDHLQQFAHLLYHFCTLSILSPLVNSTEGHNENIRPRDVCDQAAHNILTLVTPYAQGPGFRDSLGLVPRFLSAAVSYIVMQDDKAAKLSDYSALHPQIKRLGLQAGDIPAL